MFGVPVEERQSLYAALGREPGEVFPLRFSADPTLVTGHSAGEVHGFYRFAIGDGSAQIEL
jgi:hypothetical protein